MNYKYDDSFRLVRRTKDLITKEDFYTNNIRLFKTGDYFLDSCSVGAICIPAKSIVTQVGKVLNKDIMLCVYFDQIDGRKYWIDIQKNNLSTAVLYKERGTGNKYTWDWPKMISEKELPDGERVYSNEGVRYIKTELNGDRFLYTYRNLRGEYNVKLRKINKNEKLRKLFQFNE